MLAATHPTRWARQQLRLFDPDSQHLFAILPSSFCISSNGFDVLEAVGRCHFSPTPKKRNRPTRKERRDTGTTNGVTPSRKNKKKKKETSFKGMKDIRCAYELGASRPQWPSPSVFWKRGIPVAAVHHTHSG